MCLHYSGQLCVYFFSPPPRTTSTLLTDAQREVAFAPDVEVEQQVRVELLQHCLVLLVGHLLDEELSRHQHAHVHVTRRQLSVRVGGGKWAKLEKNVLNNTRDLEDKQGCSYFTPSGAVSAEPKLFSLCYQGLGRGFLIFFSYGAPQ